MGSLRRPSSARFLGISRFNPLQPPGSLLCLQTVTSIVKRNAGLKKMLARNRVLKA